MVFIQFFLVTCLVSSAFAANAIEVLGPNGLIGGNSVKNPTCTVGTVQNIDKNGWNGSVATIGGNPTGGDALVAVAPNNSSSGISAVNVATGQGATNPGSLGSGLSVSALDIGNGGVKGTLSGSNGKATTKATTSNGWVYETTTTRNPRNNFTFGSTLAMFAPFGVNLGNMSNSCAYPNRKNWTAADAKIAFANTLLTPEQRAYILQVAANATNNQATADKRCKEIWTRVAAKYPPSGLNQNTWFCITGCGGNMQHGSFGPMKESIGMWFGDVRYQIMRPAPISMQEMQKEWPGKNLEEFDKHA